VSALYLSVIVAAPAGTVGTFVAGELDRWPGRPFVSGEFSLWFHPLSSFQRFMLSSPEYVQGVTVTIRGTWKGPESTEGDADAVHFRLLALDAQRCELQITSKLNGVAQWPVGLVRSVLMRWNGSIVESDGVAVTMEPPSADTDDDASTRPGSGNAPLMTPTEPETEADIGELPEAMTERDRQIVRLWREGWTDTRIANRLGIQQSTIATRVSVLRNIHGSQVVPFHGRTRTEN
jgi:hypothetical protein